VDFRPCLRVHPLARLALPHFKRPEAGQGDFLTALQRFGDDFERRIDDFFVSFCERFARSATALMKSVFCILVLSFP
jgi:hypothetical protein